MTSPFDEPLVAFLSNKQPWLKDARCLGSETDVFFEKGWEDEAMHICAGCVVDTECVTQALIEEEGTEKRYGIRATTPAQRDVIARRGGLQGRDPFELCSGRDGDRRVPGIPRGGVVWTRTHQALARKLRALFTEYRAGQALPSVADLSAAVGCTPTALIHVLRELWAIGVLDKRGRYVYAGENTTESREG